jgi:hypothetical protein
MMRGIVESEQHTGAIHAESTPPPNAAGRPSRDGMIWIAGIGCGIALLLCLCVAGGVFLYTTVVDAGPRAPVTPEESSDAPEFAARENLLHLAVALDEAAWTIVLSFETGDLDIHSDALARIDERVTLIDDSCTLFLDELVS